MHIQWQQHILELGVGLTLANHRRAEISQTDATHFDFRLQLVYQIVAIVPDAGILMAGADKIIVVVGHEQQTPVQTFLHNFCQLLFLVSARRKLFIGIPHSQLVILAYPLQIGIGKIQLFVFRDFHQGCRIVHDTLPAV